MLNLSSVSKGLEFWSVNHIPIYENSESKIFKTIKFLVEMSNIYPSNLLGTNICKALEFCW